MDIVAVDVAGTWIVWITREDALLHACFSWTNLWTTCVDNAGKPPDNSVDLWITGFAHLWITWRFPPSCPQVEGVIHSFPEVIHNGYACGG
jgi:hypothetical protein